MAHLGIRLSLLATFSIAFLMAAEFSPLPATAAVGWIDIGPDLGANRYVRPDQIAKVGVDHPMGGKATMTLSIVGQPGTLRTDSGTAINDVQSFIGNHIKEWIRVEPTNPGYSYVKRSVIQQMRFSCPAPSNNCTAIVETTTASIVGRVETPGDAAKLLDDAKTGGWLILQYFPTGAASPDTALYLDLDKVQEISTKGTGSSCSAVAHLTNGSEQPISNSEAINQLKALFANQLCP